AGNLERAGVDLRRVRADRRRVAAVAAARRVAVAVEIDVLVDLAVAVVVDGVAADFRARHGLFLAQAPRAGRVAGLHAGLARADAAVEGEQVPDVERPADVVGLARRRPRHRFEVPEVRRPRRRGRAQLLVLLAGLDEIDGGLGVARRDRAPPRRGQPRAPDR